LKRFAVGENVGKRAFKQNTKAPIENQVSAYWLTLEEFSDEDAAPAKLLPGLRIGRLTAARDTAVESEVWVTLALFTLRA